MTAGQANTLAYVRLEDGTVSQLAEGDAVPEGALPEDVDRLTAAGVLGASKKTPAKG